MRDEELKWINFYIVQQEGDGISKGNIIQKILIRYCLSV